MVMDDPGATDFVASLPALRSQILAQLRLQPHTLEQLTAWLQV
jgi:hypothetical protein